jgi:hypothetical protein
MIEDALRTRLLAVTAIADQISQRMYVNQAPQGVDKPYVVYFIVSNTPEYTAHCIQDNVIIQYSVFANTYSQARTIANLIRENLEPFFGIIDGVSVTAIRFDGIGASEKEKNSQLAHISYDFKIIINKQ